MKKKAFSFDDAVLPPKEERDEMAWWDQSGPLWKTWRSLTATIGSSSMAVLLALSVYKLVCDFMDELRGVVEKPDMPQLPLLYGHVFEPVNKIFFKKKTQDLFGETTIRDVGVLFNLKQPWETSSPDGLLFGNTITLECREEKVAMINIPGTFKKRKNINRDGVKILTINLNESLIECKCPLRAYYPSFPMDYLPQVQRQMTVCNTQEEAPFTGRSWCFLSALITPLVEDRETGVATILANKPWTLKIWVVPHCPKYEAWCQKMFAAFRASYKFHPNTREKRFAYNPKLVSEMPEVPIYFVGEYDCGCCVEPVVLEDLENIETLDITDIPETEGFFHAKKIMKNESK